jgi:hypothetical protein
MTTTPDLPVPDDGEKPDPGSAPGVELGLAEEAGGTFEPEEDPETGD